MKIIINMLYLFLVTCMFSCAQGEKKQPNTIMEGKQFLEAFYTSYITELSKDDMNPDVISTMRNNHFTSSLLKETNDLDYDPLLKAQDVTNQMLNTLTVKYKDSDFYQVCYKDEYSDSGQICVDVEMKKDGDKWKIHSLK